MRSLVGSLGIIVILSLALTLPTGSIDVPVANDANATKWSLTIFYDSAPQSRAFFRDTICTEPWLSLPSLVYLELVPFGNTRYQYIKSTHRYEFLCTKGSNCLSVVRHSCAVQPSLGRNVTDKMLWSVCRLFKGIEPSAEEENKCTDRSFLANSGTRTESIRPAILHFPAVMINETYNETQSRMFVEHFDEAFQGLFSQSAGQERLLNFLGMTGLCIMLIALSGI